MALRTRNRNSAWPPYVSHYGYIEFSDPSISTTYHLQNITVGKLSSGTISDEIGPRGYGSRCRNVTHSTSETNWTSGKKVSPWEFYAKINNVDIFRRTTDFIGWGVTGIPSGVFSGSPPETYGAFTHSFARSQTEQIPVQLSLPNFLLELDEIPKLGKTLGDLSRFGQKSFQSLRSSLNTASGRRRFSEQTAKQFGSLHLAWNFGVKPLIADIRSTIDLSEKVRKRINFLKKTKGKRVNSRRFSTFEATPLRRSYGFDGSGGEAFARGIRQRTTYGAGISYTHNLGGLEDANRHLAALAAAAGFNKPLSVLWEAIPYSFLIDYVSNVGDIMSEFTAFEPYEGSVTVLDGWSSSKLEQVAEYGYTCPRAGTSILSTVKTVNYGRQRGISTNAGLAFDTTLTRDQALNVAALLL